MDLLHRFRNLTALVATILAQLILLAYQVRTNQEVRLIRVWAVSTVTPLARVLETGRSSTVRFFKDYFVLLDVRDENKRLKTQLETAQMENQRLRTDLETADRAQALAIFQSNSKMKTLAARVIGNTTDSSSKAVIVDRGSVSGVQKGMAVITPGGIVGKITNVYLTASYALLITDPTFGAGVVSQKGHLRGMLRGQGDNSPIVDNIQNEQTVEQGELFYTSGDDLIFPRGLLAGSASVVRPGKNRKEIILTPAGFQNGLEDVLIVLEGDHAPIPEAPAPNQSVHIQPPPVDVEASTENPAPKIVQGGTDMDRLADKYKKIGEDQKFVYGERGRGAPNFNAGFQPQPGPAKAASPTGNSPVIAAPKAPPKASPPPPQPSPATSPVSQ